MAVSFQALLDAHQARVHRAALGFMRNPDAAQDAAQDALLKAFAARASYDANRPFYPWMYRIVRNTCFDRIAKAKRRPQAEIDVDAIGTDQAAPDEEVRRKADAARLWRALETLTEEHREVVNMRHFQDLSYAEMGELLGIKEGTVMSRLFRARRALAAAVSAQIEQRKSREEGSHER